VTNPKRCLEIEVFVNLTQVRSSPMSTDKVRSLRQRMIEDMSLRNLAPRTQEAYIRGCKKLAAFLRSSPDTTTAEDIRLFQLRLAEQGVSICARNRTMTGVAFLFRVTASPHR
jgi:hypothetical protein